MTNEFLTRHIGLSADDIKQMLQVINTKSLDDMIAKTLPKDILMNDDLKLGLGQSEIDISNKSIELSNKNQLLTSFIGQGYYNTITPSVIKKNILENPSWYSAYTPYQAEISQGRLEMLLNFQQMIIDLTGMDISNASLLDEPTSVAEAVSLCQRANNSNKFRKLFVDKNTHPQTISVLTTRTKPVGIEIIIDDMTNYDFKDCFAAVLSYPNTLGQIFDLRDIINKTKVSNTMSIVSVDLMALTLLKPPAEMGADIVVGSSQRFGVPLGFGGPHAGFLATKNKYKRVMPGRIIGVSKDVAGNKALRMAMQTREQHIRRDKATSNICTAQVLLAVIAVAYAIYHGRDGLKRIANRIHKLASKLKNSLVENGIMVLSNNFFDTITITNINAEAILTKAVANNINLRKISKTTIAIAIDETTKDKDITKLLALFNASDTKNDTTNISIDLLRNDEFLSHEVFNNYHSETEMMRYLHKLATKDIALNQSMIALGSCTMKLNSATEIATMNLSGFANLHPFVPKNQTLGYQKLFNDLENYLKEITGYDAISLQPNAGSQGEFAGLLAIQKYHNSKGDSNRNICLIPTSAHGTNPASAVMAGMVVKIIKCDKNGNVDLADLKDKLQKHSANISAIMITYPSTHGVFESHIRKICNLVHSHNGQVYLDGANLNAMIGLAQVGKFGADVSHINLHKTFAIPHGGGGPGMGPVGVKKHLAKFLPGDPLIRNSGAVSATKYGSASILPISWSYIKLLGKDGLKQASKIAILNANYIAKKLAKYYPILYCGDNGFVAHECILDLRPIKKISGINEEDIAKRLIDYNFHAPTMSFPVAGTLMIEPTESESKTEIDRFITAMISIRYEIDKVTNNNWDKNNNPLKNAPHTINELALNWNYPYSREEAVYPLKSLQQKNYFPPVKRIDNVYGERNLFCSCPII